MLLSNFRPRTDIKKIAIFGIFEGEYKEKLAIYAPGTVLSLSQG
jgi:hypothetical protein